jgi:hypothetical protein
MTADASILFLLACTACAASAFAARKLLWHWMKQVPAGNRSLPMVIESELAPAELAYLLRDGDMTHTMLVLIVDLVHRAAKSHGEGQPVELRPYEAVIWTSVKEHMSRWAQQKADEYVPIRDMRNPWQWAARWRVLKRFFSETLRQFISDTLKDPLHIRRYFSLSCIVRFGLELYTSAARQNVESALRARLSERNMLVPSQRRLRCAKLFGVLALLVVAAGWVSQWQIMPNIAGLAYLTVLVFSFVNAGALKLLLWLPSLIPTYDEFSRVASGLPREGRRIALVRAVLRAIGLLLLLIGTGVLALLLLGEFTGVRLLLQIGAHEAGALLAGSSLLALSALQCLIDAYFVATRDLPSVLADRRIRSTLRSIAHTSPLNSLKSMLGDAQYDQTFSDVVAVYGMETLWLLG